MKKPSSSSSRPKKATARKTATKKPVAKKRVVKTRVVAKPVAKKRVQKNKKTVVAPSIQSAPARQTNAAQVWPPREVAAPSVERVVVHETKIIEPAVVSAPRVEQAPTRVLPQGVVTPRITDDQRLSLEGRRIILRAGVSLCMIVIFGVWAYNFRNVLSIPETLSQSPELNQAQDSLTNIYLKVNEQLDTLREPGAETPPASGEAQPSETTPTPTSSAPIISPEELLRIQERIRQMNAEEASATP